MSDQKSFGLDTREAPSPKDERVNPSTESMAARSEIVKLTATNSMLGTFLDCRMRYVWRYLRELVPITFAVPLVWGDLGHRLIEMLYRVEPGLLVWGDVEAAAAKWIDGKVDTVRGTLDAQPFGDQLGDARLETVRSEATEIADEVLAVLAHYRDTRVALDWQEYDFHMVEQTFRVPLPTVDGRRHAQWSFAGKWDLVATRRATGVCKLWDHKFSKRRLEELQIEGDTDTQPLGYMYGATFLATTQARLLRPGDAPLWSASIPTPQGFVHNWIRRAVPTEPGLLAKRKSPTLSKAKTHVTTTALYRQAIARHNLDESDYADHLAWLGQNEPSFVRRSEPNIGGDEIVRWAFETAAAMRDVRLVERDERQAYRNPKSCRRIGRSRCPYIPLCYGDPTDARTLSQFRHEQAHIELADEPDENDTEGDA
jgi:PD-(D/E)XK nuclease superfamily